MTVPGPHITHSELGLHWFPQMLSRASEMVLGVAWELPGSEMGDIELTYIFTCSGAPRRARSGQELLPSIHIHGTQAPGP